MKYILTRSEYGITTYLGEYSKFEKPRRILRGIQAKWWRIAEAKPELRLIFSIKSNGRYAEWRMSRKYGQGQMTIAIYTIKKEISE